MSDEHDTYEPKSDGISDHSAEEWLHDACRELGVNMAMAIQIYAYADEHPTQVIKNHDAAEVGRKVEAKFRSIFEILVNYTDNQKSAAEIKAAIKMAAREVGFYYLAGGLKCSGIEVAELAKSWNMDKQMLNKLAKTFTTKMKLAGHPNQRTEKACKKMSESRINQIKNEH